MLPVMIVLFAAVYHFYARGRAELATSGMARSCAWQYVMSGCRDAGSLCAGLGVTRGGDVEQKEPDQNKEPEPEDASYRRGKEQHTSALEKVAHVPVVRQITHFLFGEVASVSASTTTKKFRSQDELRTRNQIYLVCNTVSESWGQKIEDSLCSMAKSMFGNGVPGC